jgi:transcriptional regulator GlxA family with amidase domain
MRRRDLFHLTATLSFAAPFALAAQVESQGHTGPPDDGNRHAVRPLTAPVDGRIAVAFLLSDQAVVIDFAGPWEVFDTVHVPGPHPHPFEMYTVAETTAPIRTSSGMTIVPDYTLVNAPSPKVIVIPAQQEPSEAVLKWLRSAAQSSDVTMSVCTGAFVLARTGLLSGKAVTTHHGAYAELAMAFPDITVKRGARFVEVGNLASSGGLTSGIDLALHVVERYFGRAVALSTADDLEYQGLGWMNPDSNSKYAQHRVSTDQHPLCPVCEMDVDVASAPRSSYRGRTYYFCMTSHKELFDAFPSRFIAS